MKAKTKLISTIVAMCLVITLGVFGILAVKTLNMTVGGNISFSAEGVSFSIGQGKFYQSDEITEYVDITTQSGKMQGFSMDTNTKIEDVSNKIASWTNLELKLDSQGDAILKFNIKNDMTDKQLYVLFSVALGENKNDNMEINSPTSQKIDPNENKDIVITFDVIDTSINAGLSGFEISLGISEPVEINKESGFVSNQTNKKYTNVKYNLNQSTKTASVVRASDDISGELVIFDKVYCDGKEYVVNAIESNAFSECKNLTGDLIIPNSVKVIGDYAFNSCTGFNGKLVISDNVTNIGNWAFCYCKFVGNLILPKNLQILGGVAFRGCDGFTGELVIPSTLKKIGWRCFADMTSLNKIVVHSQIEKIEMSSFYGCSSLGSIVIMADNPPLLGDGTEFSKTNNCPIFVPLASVEIYKQTTLDYWNLYTNRIYGI